MPNTFILDKKTFVTGLFWQPLTGLEADHKKESKKLAKELNFDLAVRCTTAVSQIGFGAAKDDLKPGMLSTAAIVSKSIEVESGQRDFLCAAEVEHGRFIYVAQRGGVILHNGDIYGEEDEIRARILADLSLGDWPMIYAPDHWAVSYNAKERKFIDFIPKKGDKFDYKKWWALQPVDRMATATGNPSRYIVPLLLITVVAGGGFYGYHKWQEKKRIEAERQAMLAAIAAGQAVAIPHPWKDMPRVLAAMNDCQKAMGQVSTFWPGNWTPQDGTCANGTFTISWKRKEYGWIEHLKAVEPKAILSADGTTASLSVPIEATPGEDEALPDENTRVIAMQSIAQQYKLSIVLTSVAQPPALTGQQAPVQDWREMKWAIQGLTLPPAIVLKALDGNGFRATQLQADFNQNGAIKWNMEGTQYVKP